MIRATMFAAALLLTACGAGEPTLRELDQVGRDSLDPSRRAEPDTCEMAAHQSFVGMDPAAIDQSALPQHARVICYGCLPTQDRNPHRLNLQLGRDGKVESLRCG